jgi:hypothetical protein
MRNGRGTRGLLAGAALLVGTSCAVLPPAAVPLQAGVAEVEALAGEWAGEYWSGATGRSGSIVFRLTAATGAAEGDIVMLAPGAVTPPRRMPGAPEGAAGTAPPQPLAIRFVRADGDRVHGTLENYADPECGCALSTAFDGVLRGDVIEGTFTTRGPPGHAQTAGNWRVHRRTR